MRGAAAIRDCLMKTVCGENVKCRNFRPIKTICRFLPSYIQQSCTAENYLKKTRAIMFPRKHCAVKIMRYSCVCISSVIRGTTFSNICLRTGRTSSLFRNADFTSGLRRQNSATGILKPCICCFHWAWLYVIRPVVGGLIPPGIVALLKRGETWWKTQKEQMPENASLEYSSYESDRPQRTETTIL